MDYEIRDIKRGHLSQVPFSEYNNRRQKVSKLLSDARCDAMLFFSSTAIYYLSGSCLLSTERPIVFIYKTDGDCALFVPTLEREHAEENIKTVSRIVCYPEYPTPKHPMLRLADLLRDMGLSGKSIAADSDGYGAYWGYDGPKLSEVMPDCAVTVKPRLVLEMMKIKSRFEIEMLKESAKWGNLAHQLLQDYTKPGLNELDVSNRASNDATKMMIKTLGRDFKLDSLTYVGANANYRGQIGKHTFFSHSNPTGVNFKRGDLLGTGAGSCVFGYRSELERIMFVGEPDKEQVYYYNLCIQAQNAAFAAIKPGIPCSEVDKAMLRFYEENNLMQYWRHHTGHSVGMIPHEPPFFDIGDNTMIEPGMVFTVEPGIYVPDVGGFRLSDTLWITEDGAELITYYPRDIESLICE